MLIKMSRSRCCNTLAYKTAQSKVTNQYKGDAIYSVAQPKVIANVIHVNSKQLTVIIYFIDECTKLCLWELWHSVMVLIKGCRNSHKYSQCSLTTKATKEIQSKPTENNRYCSILAKFWRSGESRSSELLSLLTRAGIDEIPVKRRRERLAIEKNQLVAKVSLSIHPYITILRFIVYCEKFSRQLLALVPMLRTTLR